MRKFEIGKRYVFEVNGLRFRFTCTGRSDGYVKLYSVYTRHIVRKINVILDAFDEEVEAARINKNYTYAWMYADNVA